MAFLNHNHYHDMSSNSFSKEININIQFIKCAKVSNNKRKICWYSVLFSHLGRPRALNKLPMETEQDLPRQTIPDTTIEQTILNATYKGYTKKKDYLKNSILFAYLNQLKIDFISQTYIIEQEFK